MAEENEEQEQSEEKKPKANSGKTKLIIAIVICVLLMILSIGGTLFLLGFFDSGEVEEETVEEEVVEEPVNPKPSPAMYFPIKPAFVVNFQSRGRQRFLQVDVTVMTRNQDVYTAIQAHLPLIKNRLVMLLGGQVYEELQTDEGRELLRQQALEAIQGIMEQEIGKTGVEQVLFTNFVMQ